MPTRAAVLIGCPGEKNFLRGVAMDLVSMRNYLKSPRGGGWYDGEIQTLKNPTFETAYNFIQSTYADYVLVYFSGHGYTGRYNERNICMKDINVTDLLLINDSPRQLVIVDACRTRTPASIGAIPETGDPYSSFDGVSEARKVFDRYILSSPLGAMIVHSTHDGTPAHDDGYGRGGVFTLALLTHAMNLTTQKPHGGVHIGQMLPRVGQIMQHNGYNQSPCITYNIGSFRVPFVIDAPYIRVNRQVGTLQRTAPQSSNNNWIFDLLGLGLSLFAIGLFVSND